MTYAFKTEAGAWIEVRGDTWLPGFGEATADGVRHDVLVSEAWAASLSPQVRAARGLVDVVETDPPADVTVTVTGDTVIDVDGVPTRSWTTATRLLADIKAQRLRAAQAWHDQLRIAPMTWDFGATAAKDDAGVSAGAAGVQQLQLTPDAQADWQAVTQAAALAVANGQGATILPLRTLGNVWVQTSCDQVLQVFAVGDGVQPAAFTRILGMRQRLGAIKAAIAGANTKAACAAIDITAGYPA